MIPTYHQINIDRGRLERSTITDQDTNDLGLPPEVMLDLLPGQCVHVWMRRDDLARLLFPEGGETR